ncbi:hypothetical protein NEF87_003165 [Candidatus Lokiarchaeum ossiferum]|uniref:EamA domain-containing protein n=1 Tax=Candidatus Lokiarchaeum ossiferum TaxID=2951803 RepID=A0ABY6HTX2_9ARCH|nr:hypothetical protein NEF87_003165 [Candidatus Lokiarchaeum sp. B-35]
MKGISQNLVLRSYLLATLTFVIWGTSFAIGKFVTPSPLSPFNITFFRTVIAALTLFIIIALKGQIKAWFVVFRQEFLKYLIIGVFFYGCGFILEYWALARTEASNQAMLSNTMTFWVVLINFFVFKQQIKKNFIVGLILAFIGVILILLTDEFNFSSATIIGDVGTLIAYIIWGMYSAFTAKMNEKYNPLFSTLSIFISSLILLLPMALIQGGFQEITQMSSINWLALLYLGIICGGIAFWIYNIALSNEQVSSEYIVIFSLLNPIIGVVTGIILLGEGLVIREIIGIIIILSAIVLANCQPNNMDSIEIISAKL